jgi:hypothetical protein
VRELAAALATHSAAPKSADAITQTTWTNRTTAAMLCHSNARHSQHHNERQRRLHQQAFRAHASLAGHHLV